MKNLVFIGMRGAGKSTVGQKVAQKLGRKFFDSDAEIEKFAGKKIAEIFEKNGEKKFRELEKKIIKKLSREKNAVIATGGGAILDAKNVENLRKNGILIFLNAPIEVLQKRIFGDKNRPSLTGKNPADELAEIWKKRQKKYFAAADFEIFDDGKILEKEKNTEKIAEKIVANFAKIWRSFL